ncbi:transglutaminase-like domain-containing protein [Leucobacter chromiireducens]|uniref:transglutaminase-like domain-containing protein n=1 Tax=Leucobacter chromiireducens TaxID=283877 RepID=UPI000F635CE0|nr:transglutaminase family protein [Leucobacter chromiireducens]
MDTHLNATPVLDFDHPSIQSLLAARGWAALDRDARIAAAYDFVRELPFGYNLSDDRAASEVLSDGYGQCNTKTTLLMALLRALGIPTRFHGATIHKRLQRGIVRGVAYRLAPESILHSWAEVEVDGAWVGLEGVILDAPYLAGLRRRVRVSGAFLGYGVGTENLADPPIAWCGADTAIQQTGVNRDFGVFDDPDAFYARYGANLTGLRGVIYRSVVRPRMNRRVASIRAAG